MTDVLSQFCSVVMQRAPQFVAEVLNKALARLHQLCEECGIDSRRQEEDQPSKISFRLLRGLLLIADDPDAEVFGTYATGVRVGVGVRR